MIEEKAYAKVNLGLKTINKRTDGYHNLKMIMVSIDHYDTLFFAESDAIVVECIPQTISMLDNLVYKTALLMKKRFEVKSGAWIRIEKRIKIGGGLGGGSSDAAAAIRGLNRLWNLGLPVEEMREIAIEIGSDVPYCIEGLPAVVEGRGEIISPFPIEQEFYLVVVSPDYSMSTKEVFASHRIKEQEDSSINNLRDALMGDELSLVGDMLINALETTVLEIAKKQDLVTNKEIKECLLECGAEGSVMSGSGSTVVGLAKTFEKASEITEKLKKTYPKFEIYVAKIRQNANKL